MRSWLILLTGLASGGALAAAGLPFQTTQVKSETVPHERVLDGTVEVVNKTTVSAQTSGEVTEVRYDVGDFVKQGSVIVRIRPIKQKATLDQARAQVAEAQARLRQAEKEYRRIRDIYARKLVAKAKLDAAEAELKAARARLAAARAALKRAEEQVRQTEVRAPYSGIVTEKHVDVGEFVNVGQPLMTGISLDKLRVSVEVPQSAINRLRRHKQARVLTDALCEEGRAEAGGITFFPYADPVTNTFRVRVDLAQACRGLLPGMFVKVAFLLGEQRELLVPTAAVAYRGEVTGVYVIDDQDRPHFRQIRLGRRHGEAMIVLAGLAEGERIALDPIAAGIYLKRHVEAAEEQAHD